LLRISAIALALALSAGPLLGQSTSVARPSPPQDFSVKQVVREAFTAYQRPLERVLTDSAALDSAWALLYQGKTPLKARPVVDFTRSMVLLLALGSRPSTRFAIALDSVRQQRSGMAVYYTELEPGRGCVVGPAPTQPALLAELSRTSERVKFTRQTRRQDCE
jgi:hypothetical protein